MDTKIPTLKTDRLVLKQMTEDDSPQLYQIWSDDEVTHFMYFNSLDNSYQASEEIRLIQESYHKDLSIVWGIFTNEDHQLIGTIGFHKWDHQSRLSEIGYELARAYWDNDYMSEALKAVLNFGFGKLNINRIEAWVFPENVRSIGLLNKLGFINEGLLRQHVYCKGSFRDEFCFSILSNDWPKSGGTVNALL